VPFTRARPESHALASIARRIGSLSKAHKLADVPSPCQRPEVRELQVLIEKHDEMSHA